MVRSIVFINGWIRVSCCINHHTYSHTTNWNCRPSLFNVIIIQHKCSYNNIHFLSDMIFVLGIVTVRFNFDRGNHFAVGSAADNVKQFLIHVDEYKSNFCSWDNLYTLPKQPKFPTHSARRNFVVTLRWGNILSFRILNPFSGCKYFRIASSSTISPICLTISL